MEKHAGSMFLAGEEEDSHGGLGQGQLESA